MSNSILSKCDVSICKASCCGPVPIKNTVLRCFENLINKGSKIDRMGSVSLVYDPKTVRCGFLSEEHRCKIYENRPDVCKKFGSGEESHQMLKCHYLGQISKQESENKINEIIERIK